MSRIPFTPKQRFEVLSRDNFTCQYCGARAPNVQLVVDHVIPVAHGGTNEPANLVAACFACNAGKGSACTTRIEIRARIWQTVRLMPRGPAPHDDEYLRGATAELVEAFAAIGFEPYLIALIHLLEGCTWYEWRDACWKWFSGHVFGPTDPEEIQLPHWSILDREANRVADAQNHAEEVS